MRQFAHEMQNNFGINTNWQHNALGFDNEKNEWEFIMVLECKDPGETLHK